MANIKISELSSLTGDNLQDVDLLTIVDSDGNNDGSTTDKVTKSITVGDLKTGIFASTTFTGTPTAPTATAGTNTTQIATTQFVTGLSSALGGGSPTFDALADTAITSIGDEEIISYDNASSKYVNKTLAEAGIAISASPTFTGNPQSNAAPTSGDHLTNKTYVDAQVAELESTSNFTTSGTDSQSAGYQVFPSGLKMAWGECSPIAKVEFPTGVNFTVPPTITTSANEVDAATYRWTSTVGNVTTTDFEFTGTYGLGGGARYIAIGH